MGKAIMLGGQSREEMEKFLNAKYVGEVSATQDYFGNKSPYIYNFFIEAAPSNTGTYYFVYNGYWLNRDIVDQSKMLMCRIVNGVAEKGALRYASNVPNYLYQLGVVQTWTDNATNISVANGKKFSIYQGN